MNLQLWTNGVDFVIASSQDDARAIVKEQCGYADEEADGICVYSDARGVVEVLNAFEGEPIDAPTIRCPHGVPGDRIWVRETWGVWQRCDATPGGNPYDPCYLYRSTDDMPDGVPEWALLEPFRWRPSIHMPRKASRILLEIVDVRVERLQSISEEDARAEGVERDTEPCDHPRMSCGDVRCLGPTYRAAFAEKWMAIYGAESWRANPWCWALSLRRLDAAARLEAA